MRARKPERVVAVALANKLARICWAIMSTGESFRQERFTQGLKKEAAKEQVHFPDFGKRNDVMIPTVATESRGHRRLAVTSLELVAMIATEAVGNHQGQRSKPAPKGRTYDRSRPKRSKRQNTACQ